MKERPDERLFVYGELCKPDVLMSQLGRIPAAVPAVLDDHRRRRNPETGYYRAEAQRGARLAGLLLRGLGRAELECLDQYEDVAGGEYRRCRVRVTPLVGGESSRHDGASRGAGSEGGEESTREEESAGRDEPVGADELPPAEEAWIYLGG